MNLKKILAGIAAGAMVFASLAVPTLADDVYSTTGPEAGGGGETYSLAGLEIDYTAIDEIVIEISVDSGYVNGCVGYNSVSTNNWASVGYEISSTTGTIDVNSLAGDIADTDSLQLQFWWINPIYDEGGNITGAGTVTVNSITIYDASGEVLYQDPAAEVVEETEPEVVEQTYSAGVYYTDDQLDNPYDEDVDISTMTLAEIVPDTEAVSDITSLTYTLTCADDVNFNEWTYLYFVVTVDGVSTIYQVQGITGDDEWTNGLVLTDQVIELTSTIAAGQTYSVSAYTQSWAGAANEVFTIEMTVETYVTTGDTDTNTETNTTGTTTDTEDDGTTTSSDDDVATSSNNDASDDGDVTSAAYLLVLVAMAGVALAGVKRFQA